MPIALSTCPFVRGCPTDAQSFRELLEVVTYEVGLVVGDDGVGHAEPVDDVQEELDGLLGVDCVDRLCLYPFGELVNCDK